MTNFKSQPKSFRNLFVSTSSSKSSLFIKSLYTVFTVLIPMLIIFLLLGEVNLLGQNAIVGQNARWYGPGFVVAANKSVQFDVFNFYKWKPIDLEHLKTTVNAVDFQKIVVFNDNFSKTYHVMFGSGVLTNYTVWIAMLIDLIVALSLAILLIKFVPKLRWDLLTPVVSWWFSFFILIITGFMPAEIWGYLLRVVIIIVSLLIPIVIMVQITNRLMVKSKHFETYSVDMYNEFNDAQIYYDQARQKRAELKQKANPKEKYEVEE